VPIQHLRELHLTHDPDTGRIAYAAVIDSAGNRFRLRAGGKYDRARDQPEAYFTMAEDLPSEPLPPDRYVVASPRLLSVQVKAWFRSEELVYEQVPQDWQPFSSAALFGVIAELRGALRDAAQAQCGCLGSTISEYDESREG